MNDVNRTGGTSVAAPSMLAVASAFAAVYLVWGSTYLAIRVAVQTLPPFMMAGVRFIIAGAILYIWSRTQGAARPNSRQWLATTIVGGLLLLGGNGGVVWAETRVDSGVAALLVATVPLWMIVLHALRPDGARPNLAEVGGLILGFLGVAVLINPFNAASSPEAHAGSGLPAAVDPWGAAALVGASLSWSVGSLYSRRADVPKEPLLATGMNMLGGGVLLIIAGAAAGEVSALDPGQFSSSSLLALAYLVVFGSLVGFTAYMWLLRVTTPAKVSTYAYVNPVVAVLLGWAVLHEPLGPRTFAAMALIVTGVVLTTALGRRASTR